VMHLIFASLFFGITILIRPTNVVLLFMIPFLTGGKEALSGFLRNFKHLFLSAIIIGVLLFIQMLSWKLQTGSWIVWSYAGEGFYFTRPALSSVLFSYDKGWFIYTPLAFIAMAGFFPLWKVNWVAAISIASTLAAAIYFTAAWWCWDYGNAFGMRPLIDFYALLAILIAALISWSKKKSFQVISGAVLTVMVTISGIQTYQYYHHILQQYSMSRDKYWYVFLKTGAKYQKILGGNADLMPYTKKPPGLILEAKNDFSTQVRDWMPPALIPDPVNSTNRCAPFDSTHSNLIFQVPVDSSFRNADELYVKISLRRLELTPHSSSYALIIAGLKNRDQDVFTYDFAMNDFPDEHFGEWRTYHYAFWIRKQHNPYDSFKLEIQSRGKQSFLLDDVNLQVYRMFQK